MIKKYLQWFGMFLILGFFSLYNIHHMTGETAKAALAHTIEQDNADQNGPFIVVEDSEEQDYPWWFLRRFRRLERHNMVCRLRQEQYQALSLLFDTSTEELKLKDKTATVAMVEGEELNVYNLKRILELSEGEDLDCRVVEHNNIFYFLFNTNVS
jgi:hypothetical protein